jgi:hypothetical protein
VMRTHTIAATRAVERSYADLQSALNSRSSARQKDGDIVGYAVTVNSRPTLPGYSGRLTAGPELAGTIGFPETMLAAWLARSGVVLVCPAADSARWQRFADSWQVRHAAPLTVGVSWDEALPALIIPPAVAAAVNFGPGQQIRCVGLRGVVLVCRAIQIGYWEPRFMEFAAACV